MTLHLLINPHMIFMYLKLFLSKQILKKKKKECQYLTENKCSDTISQDKISPLLNKVMLPCFQLSPLTLGWKRKHSEMEQVKRDF